MKYLVALPSGLIAGALLTVTHNFWSIWGFLLTIAGYIALSLEMRVYLQTKSAYLVYATGTILTILIGASVRGNELLVQANTPGYLLLFAGPVLALLPLVKKV